MATKIVRVRILSDGGMCAIPVPFDPKAAFGKVRAPVKVTLNGYTFRSTIARMGGEDFIPLRKGHREAAAVEGGEEVEVRFELDTEERRVDAPPDLATALKANPPGWERWNELSFTCQKEYAESIRDAKKPETRARRIGKAVGEIAARKAKRVRATV